MPQEWFVRRGDIERGPLTPQDVKRLVSKGIIVASDLMRTSAKPEWRQAGTVRGLFDSEVAVKPVPPPLPQVNAELHVAPLPPDLPSGPAESQVANGRPTISNVAENIKSGLTNLISTAKQAKDLATAHARKTQFTQITLPKAFAELGKEVFQSEPHREEFSDLVHRITSTYDEIAKIKATDNERPKATDIKGKLQSNATQLLALGQIAKLRLQQESLLRELGKKAFDTQGDSAGSPELLSPITSAIEEIEKINTNIDELSSGEKGPLWQRLPLAALLTVFCWPIGILLVWLNRRLTHRSKMIWTGASATAFMVLWIVIPKSNIGVSSSDSTRQSAIKTPSHFSSPKYSHDFSKDDVSIPARARSEVRFHRVEDSASSANGKWVREHGYIKAPDEFVRHGDFTVWEDEGETRKFSSGRFLHGELHGIKSDYQSNGKLSGESTYVHGKLHGPLRTWSPSGQKTAELHLFNDKKHGKAEGWYENGQKEYETLWNEDTLGDSDAWYKNGNKKSEHRRKDGLLEGQCRDWFDNGQLSKEEYCRKNLLNGSFRRWDRTGFETHSGEFKDGIAVGTWKRGFKGCGVFNCKDCGGLPYTVKVRADKWSGGTKEELLTLVEIISTVKTQNGTFPGVSATTDFSPRHGRMHAIVLRSWFGQTIGQPHLKRPSLTDEWKKIYGYRCSDGVVSLEADFEPENRIEIPYLNVSTVGYWK